MLVMYVGYQPDKWPLGSYKREYCVLSDVHIVQQNPDTVKRWEPHIRVLYI